MQRCVMGTTGTIDDDQPTRRPVQFPTYDSGGLLPGVDLENKDALMDLLDRPEDLDAAR